MDTSEAQPFSQLLHSGGVTGDACDAETVRDNEARLNVRFPQAYRAFLQIAGNGFAPFAGSLHAVVDDLMVMQHMARRRAKLPLDAFAFVVHQNAIDLFLLDDGEDPAVYRWIDFAVARPIERVSARLSAYLIDCARKLDDLRARRSGGA